MTTTATAATGTYVIRQARHEEYDAVGRLTYQGFGHHLPGAHQPDEERLSLLLDAAARAREGVLLVAEDVETGRLVGTASLLPFGSPLSRQAEEGEVELRLLAVLPETRRTGLGRRLLNESARLAAARGAERVVLDTAVDNEASQRLYRRLGYVRRPDREKERPAPKVQLVVYTLDLLPAA
ncbi:GNAT family N-acetyltransferase [Paenarthrobacter aurescens]|jgi:ribosomal protein S18 acetylase RimI-like enzyme|uniref:Acetyltransferase, GNAT family protein n=1 Tax=Paenarthrobacter aurescens (strain TC1) TaxID=290340 RepID=A1RA81_PAEAT|nr:GNAT family N-acetyltransferase [Paenarthrobacter aurescens]ABM08286.1 acetyltransferase, GNAT family protein [Paenarthrobacter aurescens TC1]